MNVEGRTVLITGGATGIGLALTRRFVSAGSTVIICGRRVERLEAVQRELPQVRYRVCDVASAPDRVALYESVCAEYPELDIVINNAGIQNRPPHLTQEQDWRAYRNEIATNIEGPVHLSLLFIQHLIRRPDAAIVNVTSRLAFSPLAFMPMYCATKAALHSFTVSLQQQLQDTSVQVVEIAPPKVQTDLGGVGLHDDGMPLDEFTDYVWQALLRDAPSVIFS